LELRHANVVSVCWILQMEWKFELRFATSSEIYLSINLGVCFIMSLTHTHVSFLCSAFECIQS
jgi:hypothetical protein